MYIIGTATAMQTLGMTKSAAAPKKMPGYVGPIQTQTEDNSFFRKVLFTGKHAQLVLMSIQAGEDIGEETHDAVDQFFRIDGGTGAIVMNGVRRPLKDGDAFLVPSGTKHNLINTSTTEPLRLYTVYSPPNHPPGTIHKTKADAIKAEEEGRDKKPKLAEEEEGDEIPATGRTIPKADVLSFFRKHPKPNDDQMHELAEEHAISPHDLETQVYGILGDKLKQS